MRQCPKERFFTLYTFSALSAPEDRLSRCCNYCEGIGMVWSPLKNILIIVDRLTFAFSKTLHWFLFHSVIWQHIQNHLCHTGSSTRTSWILWKPKMLQYNSIFCLQAFRMFDQQLFCELPICFITVHLTLRAGVDCCMYLSQLIHFHQGRLPSSMPIISR